jgi:hypothetical protein
VTGRLRSRRYACSSNATKHLARFTHTHTHAPSHASARRSSHAHRGIHTLTHRAHTCRHRRFRDSDLQRPVACCPGVWPAYYRMLDTLTRAGPFWGPPEAAGKHWDGRTRGVVRIIARCSHVSRSCHGVKGSMPRGGHTRLGPRARRVPTPNLGHATWAYRRDTPVARPLAASLGLPERSSAGLARGRISGS